MVSYFFCLPRMFLRVVGLCLGEIARRVCHELGQSRLAAEAVGLTLNLRINGAVRLYVLAACEAHRAHVVYSPVTARAAVAMPIKKAPARAELIYVFMFISCQWDLRRSFRIQLYA